MSAKLLTETEAKKYYNEGRKAAARHADLFDALYEDFSGPELWPHRKAFELGFRGLPFAVETFERIGDIKSGEGGYCAPSRNYRDDTNEKGVSVMDEAWLKTISAMMFLARGGKRITVKGIRCGIGSDGEPVVLPIK
jgi:hypothetical protein